MAVAGNFSAVVKIVEHAELQRQFVLVGSDVLAVHRERWIAVSHFQITQNLIVGAVFFEDVDHVLDRILSAGESDGAGIAVEQVVRSTVLRELGSFSSVDGIFKRAIDPRSSVGMYGWSRCFIS